MKKHVLVIDTSASSLESKLYIYEANTVREAKEKLAELNLVFAPGYIYCATIGCRYTGRENRYFDTQRTDDGLTWNPIHGGHKYNPEKWDCIFSWNSIDRFRKLPA